MSFFSEFVLEEEDDDDDDDDDDDVVDCEEDEDEELEDDDETDFEPLPLRPLRKDGGLEEDEEEDKGAFEAPSALDFECRNILSSGDIDESVSAKLIRR